MKKLLFLFGLILWFACSKTVESENKAWQNNLKKVQNLSIDYPNFKSVIEEQMQKAQKAMQDAKKISPEEQKIKAMAQANDILNNELIRKLSNFEGQRKNLRNKIDNSVSLKPDAQDQDHLKRSLQNAEKAIQEAQNLLKTTAKSEAEALGTVRRAYNIIDEAQSSLDKVISAIDKKERDKQAEKQAKEQKEEQKRKEEQKPKFAKCEYCGNDNDLALSNCKSCGAGLKKQ